MPSSRDWFVVLGSCMRYRMPKSWLPISSRGWRNSGRAILLCKGSSIILMEILLGHLLECHPKSLPAFRHTLNRWNFTSLLAMQLNATSTVRGMPQLMKSRCFSTGLPTKRNMTNSFRILGGKMAKLPKPTPGCSLLLHLLSHTAAEVDNPIGAPIDAWADYHVAARTDCDHAPPRKQSLQTDFDCSLLQIMANMPPCIRLGRNLATWECCGPW